jgi:hypothetical protein
MASSLSKKTKLILFTAGLTLTAILIYRMGKKKKEHKIKRTVVADEGYETAEDILFPRKKSLRFGA